MEIFATACGSAATIFRVINRVSKIDSMSTEGKTFGSALKGNISFKKINFSYPSRPDVQVIIFQICLKITLLQTIYFL